MRLLAALRLLRLLACLPAGFTAACFIGMLTPAARWRMISLWCRALLWALGVRVRASGRPVAGPALVVANHVSWLDILAVAAQQPATFVCKSEIAAWPAIGWLLRRVGTVFIRRGSLRDVLRVNTELRERLARGETVAAFPEGTTTDGTFVLSFRPALFQPAVDAAATIVPVMLSYSAPTAAYVGETTFLESLLAVVGERHLEVEAVFGRALAVKAGRKGAAVDARNSIAHALKLSRLRLRAPRRLTRLYKPRIGFPETATKP